MGKPKQTEILEKFTKDDKEKIRYLAMFYLKDKRDLLDHSVADAWIEAVLHVLIMKGVL